MKISDFERQRRACFIGVKAYQNIVAAHHSFNRLCKLASSKDHQILTSLFHHGVIRYAKPFLNSDTGYGKVKYPLHQIKNTTGFSVEIHNHLIDLRNTLIAHDDFEVIEPRLLIFSMVVKGAEDQPIPVSIDLANKCIGYPADLEGALKLFQQVEASLLGVQTKLHNDIATLREIALKHPDQVKEGSKYTGLYGGENIQIPVGGKHIIPPSTADDPWLNPEEPNFSKVHNGYHYEPMNLKKDFNGPEKIVFADGSSATITPKEKSTDNSSPNENV